MVGSHIVYLHLKHKVRKEYNSTFMAKNFDYKPTRWGVVEANMKVDRRYADSVYKLVRG